MRVCGGLVLIKTHRHTVQLYLWAAAADRLCRLSKTTLMFYSLGAENNSIYNSFTPAKTFQFPSRLQGCDLLLYFGRPSTADLRLNEENIQLPTVLSETVWQMNFSFAPGLLWVHYKNTRLLLFTLQNDWRRRHFLHKRHLKTCRERHKPSLVVISKICTNVRRFRHN